MNNSQNLVGQANIESTDLLGELDEFEILQEKTSIFHARTAGRQLRSDKQRPDYIHYR